MRTREVKQVFALRLAAFLALVHLLAVRELQAGRRGAAWGVLVSAAQPLAGAALWWAFVSLIGGRPAPIRGDGLTWVMAGFLLFFVHVRTAQAVASGLGRDLMVHQRATPFLFICVRGLAAAYTQGLALVLLLAVNWLGRGMVVMEDALVFWACLAVAWASGLGIGAIGMALGRRGPAGQVLLTGWVRLSFFTSGKFVVASQVSPGLRPWMEWNPLFHVIDQARGAIFVNYTARTTDLGLAAAMALGLLVVGALAESWVRRHWSVSQAAA